MMRYTYLAVLMFILASFSFATYYSNSYASMYITPDPVPYQGGSDWQYFQICAKQAGQGHVGYMFKNKLESASAELYGNYIGFDSQPVYENVSVLKVLYIDSFTLLTSPPPRCDYGVIHPLNTLYINATMQGNSSVYACLNYTQNLGGGQYRIGWWEQQAHGELVPVEKIGYHDITPVFNHVLFNGNLEGHEYVNAHAYYASKMFVQDECVTYRIKFKVQPNDPVKYDAVMWGGQQDCWKTDSCAFSAVKDPTFNEDAWDYYRNYTITTEHSPTNMETVLFNFSAAEINLTCFIGGYDRWVYVDPNNVSNRTALNFHYYLTNETDALSNKYWGVALNMTSGLTPVINGTVVEHYYCNNTPVTNNSNGNQTYFYYEAWAAGTVFPNHGITAGAGNFTVNATGGLMFGVSGVASWAYTATIFKANTTFIMNYKSVGTGTAQCIGFHTSTNCGAGDNTMWYLTGSVNQADAKAEGNNYGAAFTTPAAISTYPITYYLLRNGSASISYGHDWLFKNIIKTDTTTSTRFILFGGSEVPTHAATGFLSFIAVANTSADITWTVSVEAPATSLFMDLISPQALTYNTSTILFNITANSTTRNSVTCNKTIDGVTNNTNITILNNQYYTEDITYSIGAHTVYATCSNQTLTDTDWVTFQVTSFTVLDDNYTGGVYETNDTELNISISLGSLISNISGSVWFNGTSYIAEKVGTNSFTKNVTVPLTQTNASNVSHTWQFYITYTNGSSSFENTTSKNQNVSFAYLLANVSYNATSLLEGDYVGTNISIISFLNNATVAATVFLHNQSAIAGNQSYGFYTASQAAPQMTVYPIQTFSAFVNLTFTFGGITRNITTANTTITFSEVNLTNCTAGTIVLTYYLQDELSYEYLNGTFEKQIQYKTGSIYKNFSHEWNNTYIAQVCISPAWAIVTASSVEKHYFNNASINYEPRFYFLVNATITNVTNTIQQYLLNYTYGKPTVFTVLNAINQPLADVYVIVSRFRIENNTVETVAMGYTASDGTTTIFLEPVNAFYRFTVLDADGNILIATSELQTIACSTASATCEKTLKMEGSVYDGYWNIQGKVSWTTNYNNGTFWYVVDFVDRSGLTRTCGLDIKVQKSNKIIQNCSSFVTTSVGTVSCNLGNVSDNLYYINFLCQYNGNNLTIYNDVYDFTARRGGFGDWTLFFAILLMILLPLTAVFNLTVAIAMIPVAFGMAFLSGALDIGIASVLASVVIAIVVIYRVK